MVIGSFLLLAIVFTIVILQITKIIVGLTSLLIALITKDYLTHSLSQIIVILVLQMGLTRRLISAIGFAKKLMRLMPFAKPCLATDSQCGASFLSLDRPAKLPA